MRPYANMNVRTGPTLQHHGPRPSLSGGSPSQDAWLAEWREKCDCSSSAQTPMKSVLHRPVHTPHADPDSDVQLIIIQLERWGLHAGRLKHALISQVVILGFKSELEARRVPMMATCLSRFVKPSFNPL